MEIGVERGWEKEHNPTSLQNDVEVPPPQLGLCNKVWGHGGGGNNRLGQC